MKIKLNIKDKDTRKTYYLYFDLGYARRTISFIPTEIAELLCISRFELEKLVIGEYTVGEVYGVKK